MVLATLVPTFPLQNTFAQESLRTWLCVSLVQMVILQPLPKFIPNKKTNMQSGLNQRINSAAAVRKKGLNFPPLLILSKLLQLGKWS
jgi:hypothetical protein